jgi:uncharacterized protein YuzE
MKTLEEMMRIKVDEKSDALYIRLDESSIVESEEIQPDIILDYNDNNQAMEIEIKSEYRLRN